MVAAEASPAFLEVGPAHVDVHGQDAHEFVQ